jgi:CDP-diacylglycerol--glycerol-3-phosphate 3-phosphatidyltransferase
VKNKTKLFWLKRRWLLVAVIYFLSILLFYWLWRFAAGSTYGSRWLVQTALIGAYCLWIVRRFLPENYRPREQVLLARFGWGNSLTLLRGLLISMVGGFLFIPWPDGRLAWLPALLYTTADIADFLDGYAARITNHVTQLGVRLDMEFDSLGMLIVSLLAVWYGQLPIWFLFIGLERYFFLIGLWVREKQNLPNQPLPHSQHRRIFAGFQMGFLSVVLWPILPAEAATIAGSILALAISASFLRDWLIVIGRLDSQSDFYKMWQRRAYRLFTVYLPPVVRLVFLGCVLVVMQQLDPLRQPADWVTLFADWHLPWPGFLATFFAIIGLVAALMIILGIMGRIMAILVMFPIGFDMVVNGANLFNGVAMGCGITIVLLGTGALSLWQPEENFVLRRAGE